LKTPVLRMCPFLVSFKRRLKLFDRIVRIKWSFWDIPSVFVWCWLLIFPLLSHFKDLQESHIYSRWEQHKSLQYQPPETRDSCTHNERANSRGWLENDEQSRNEYASADRCTIPQWSRDQGIWCGCWWAFQGVLDRFECNSLRSELRFVPHDRG
jgi:hypothetical protein